MWWTMANRFAVVGGDSRQRYLAEELILLGNAVDVYGVPGLADSRTGLPETLLRAKHVILPMPAWDKSGSLQNQQGLVILPEQIAPLLRQDAVVFGGKLGGGGQILARQAHVEDYGAWEPLQIANAVLTAEGAIQLAMEETEIALSACRCLVIGAGRIGMELARRLHGLGAQVTVSARKEADFARIRAAGMTADVTGVFGLGLRQYDFVCNTVPAPILPPEKLELFRPECALIELASAPGGWDPEACRVLGLRHVPGGGLPGRVAPRTAGKIICGEILEYLRRQGR